MSQNEEKGWQNEIRRLSEAVAALDEKYNRLQQEMNQQERGKTTLVDNLLHGKASPFTCRISTIRLPEKFKVPSIAVFTRIEDSTEHLDSYRAHLDLHGTPPEVACRAFPLTLSGNARNWFQKLSLRSIDDFNDLGWKFLTQFLVG